MAAPVAFPNKYSLYVTEMYIAYEFHAAKATSFLKAKQNFLKFLESKTRQAKTQPPQQS